MLKLAKGKSVYRNRVRLFEFTISQLFRAMEKPAIRKKKDGEYMVLAEFKDLSTKEDAYPFSIRNHNNVLQYYGAVIDLDEAEIELKEIGPRLPHCKYFAYTTFSHQLESVHHDKGYEPSNRYRLIIPYDAPLNVADHKLIMAFLAAKIGVENIDLSSDAVSRPMYLPAMHPSNVDLWEFEARKKAPNLRTTLTAQEKFEISELIDQAGHADKKKFDINEHVHEGQGRNDAIAKLVGKLIHNGMDNDLIVQTAEAWNDANCTPPLSTKELHTTIKSIISGHGSRSGRWGFDEISRRVSSCTSDDFEQVIKVIATADKAQVSNAKREILIRNLARKLKIGIGIIKEEVKQQELAADEVEEEEEEKKERKTTKELRHEFREWVYIASTDKVYNTQNGISYKTEGFNRMHQSKLDKGSVLPLLLKYNCIQQADRIEFAPGRDLIFTHNYTVFANSYRKPNISPVYASCGIMIDHFRKLIPDFEERKVILDYIAYLVQYPGKKVLFMPIIKGSKGVGKSLLIERILMPILGERNVRNVKPKKVKQDFNAWQMNTQLVCFHELKLGSNRREKLELTEELKELITDNYMMASLKGVDDYDVTNKVNLFALTNHEDAIMITPDERRFYLIRSELQPQSSAYFDTLYDWLDENVEAIYHYFLYRDISDFNPYKLPESKYTKEIKESSYMWPQSVIAEAVAQPDHVFNTEVACTWNLIVNHVRDNSAGRDAMECENLIHANSSQSYKLTNALRDCGLRKYETKKGNNRIRIKGKLETVWLTPYGVEKLKSDSLRLADVKACLKNQKTINEFDED